MDINEAAHLVRTHWSDEPAPFTPEEQHRLHYLSQVCEAAGYQASATNVAHVENLLHKHGVTVPAGHEYPKALFGHDDHGQPVAILYPHGHEKNGLPVVFASAEEEHAYYEAQAPYQEHEEHEA